MTNVIYLLGETIPRHEVVYAFDVLEHTDKPKELLKEIESLGEFTAVNLQIVV